MGSASEHSEHAQTPEIRIGSRRIGPGRPTYVIAEAGVNHDGDVEQALRLIDAAAAADADAVKFQVFRADELAASSAPTATYQKAFAGESQHDLLARLELSDDDFLRLRDRCTERGVEFLATPFSVHDVDRLEQLHVRAIKTASTDLNNLPLLRRVCDTGLPLIVSTGAATAAEIMTAVGRLESCGAKSRAVLMHCVSAYPTPLDAANLLAIGALQHRFDCLVGFSDHTMSTAVGAWATAAGACVLEKHFTLDRSRPGPDHQMSLEPSELREYVAQVRDVVEALGVGGLGMNEIESDVRAVARKSIVANRNLPTGTVLVADMLAVKRPGGGIEPDRFYELIGRRLKQAVQADAALTWDMFE